MYMYMVYMNIALNLTWRAAFKSKSLGSCRLLTVAILRKISSDSSDRPFVANQRGLSGSKLWRHSYINVNIKNVEQLMSATNTKWKVQRVKSEQQERAEALWNLGRNTQRVEGTWIRARTTCDWRFPQPPCTLAHIVPHLQQKCCIRYKYVHTRNIQCTCTCTCILESPESTCKSAVQALPHISEQKATFERN